MRRTVCVLLAALAVVTAPAAADAQRTHVLVVSGLSGDPAFKKSFRDITTTVSEAARSRWGVSDSSLIVLTEDSVPATATRGRSSRDAVARAFVTLSRRVQPGDVVLVLLIGHGSGEGPGSKVNLPGPDATAAEYATWISGFTRQTVVFVNAATGSGDFVPVIRGPGRVVISATRSAVERNESVFAGFFAKALSTDESDADKDGRVSVLEAFQYATREVGKAYESTGRMQTEHALLSDTTRAMTVSFGKTAPSTNPRVTALIAERQALESEVAALRARKATMNADGYEKELERLLIAIAEKTQAIRAAGGTP